MYENRHIYKKCEFNIVEEKTNSYTFKMFGTENVSSFTQLASCCHAENGEKDFYEPIKG